MSKTAVAQQAKTERFLPSNQGVLQRKCACGNQAAGGGGCTGCAQKKLGLQRKLTIGASNDPLEREADRVAEQVMRMPINSNIGNTPPRIQRFAGQLIGQTDTTAPASVDRVLASSGRPLESALRQDMEQRFGHDFSQVRVHSGAAAEQSAREVSADAYTVGNNVVFGAGQFEPVTNRGRRLVAHELTHVVQQSGGERNHLTKSGDKYTSPPTFLQRHVLENNPTTAPTMVCPTASSSVAGYLFTTNFNMGGSTLSSVDKTVLASFATEWNLSPVQPTVRVDGFASKDGRPNDNWPLSCDRATAVANELNAPSVGGRPGIPGSSIDFFANGETEFFSASDLVPNRVAAIHAPGMASPTSQEPSVYRWTTNNSGATSADNCAPIAPVNLGVDCNPPDYKNGIEVTAFIRDHNTTYSYDVKRTKEIKYHRASDWPFGLTGPWENIARWNKAAGTDDDGHDSDECLVPIVSGSIHKIYSEDRPGFRAGGVSNSYNAYIQKANFIEFVRFTRPDGSTYDSNTTQRWHSLMLVEKSGGSWSVNTSQSEIDSGHLSNLNP